MRMVRVLRAERGALYKYVEMSKAVAGMARAERRKMGEGRVAMPR